MLREERMTVLIFDEENEGGRREKIFVWVCSHAGFVRVSAEGMFTQRFFNNGRRQEKIFLGVITCRFCLLADVCSLGRRAEERQ